MTVYTDYRFKFPLANLPQALAALVALRSADIIIGGALPTNMLGDPRDASGALIEDGSPPAFVGRQGRAAINGVDSNGNPSTSPALGDPGYWYVAIRSETPPSQVPFDPSSFGLIPCDPQESADVLGTWA